MKATVTERGQVTIPKQFRDQLGITPKTVLEFEEDHGRLIVTKVLDSDPLDRLMGCITLDKPVDELIADMRGEG